MSRPLVWTFRSRITFVRAITQINQEEKTTILLATHDLSDIEQLCDRIFMIDKSVPGQNPGHAFGVLKIKADIRNPVR